QPSLLSRYSMNEVCLWHLPATEVLNISGLMIGSYTFYFAVDLPMNGVLNMERIWVDAVTVNVQ
ncbi:MAG: hypothetical protein KKD33_09905, partial [Verrucomicrobia bacterium]|nr:hypothetical protein [Verrucomicrobiota bacterium]